MNKTNEALDLLIEKFQLEEVPHTKIIEDKNFLCGVDVSENDEFLKKYAFYYEDIVDENCKIFFTNETFRFQDYYIHLDEPITLPYSSSCPPINIRNTAHEKMLDNDTLLFDGPKYNGWFWDDSQDMVSRRLFSPPSICRKGRYFFVNEYGVENECYNSNAVSKEIDVAERCKYFEMKDVMDKYPDSFKRIFECYSAMAKDNIPEAFRCLSLCHKLNEKIYINLDAIHCLLEGVKRGDILSMRELSNIFRYHSPIRSVKWMCVAAKHKEHDSMWNLALLYLTGLFVEKSTEKAISLYNDLLEDYYKDRYASRCLYPDNDLIAWTEHNLRIITGKEKSWEKYFEIK